MPDLERESTLRGGDDFDRYRVEGLLGEGGMASVYRVRHRDLGSAHALKVLHHGWPALRQRLLAEGRAQAALRHANVVAVTDTIDVGGRPGLVMDLVDGPTLDALIDSRELSFDEIDTLAEGIIRGVAAAHRRGVVHRDLKPSNVLVAEEDGRLVPKVSDFGIAKVLEDDPSGGNRTRTGMAMGTPAYMAPEQVRDAKNVDHRADIWSLGAILYELVTRRQPFPQADLFEIMNAVCQGRYTSVDELRPDAPARARAAIAGALVVDREQRIPDCETLLAIWSGRSSAPRAGAVAPTRGAASSSGAASDTVAPRSTRPPATPSATFAGFDDADDVDDEGAMPAGRTLGPVPDTLTPLTQHPPPPTLSDEDSGPAAPARSGPTWVALTAGVSTLAVALWLGMRGGPEPAPAPTEPPALLPPAPAERAEVVPGPPANAPSLSEPAAPTAEPVVAAPTPSGRRSD
jgi:serine/threonine protein kinase